MYYKEHDINKTIPSGVLPLDFEECIVINALLSQYNTNEYGEDEAADVVWKCLPDNITSSKNEIKNKVEQLRYSVNDCINTNFYLMNNLSKNTGENK